VKIIIAGEGKVGAMLTKQLSAEGYDLTLIDANKKILDASEERYDIMAVQGNCASMEVLVQAGVKDADLLIAVTGSDELNLLCCLIAKKAGNCQTIARVRNPEFNREIAYIQEELGLALVINPEFAASVEIARILRFPSAIEISPFAKGRAEVLKFRVPESSVLDHMMVSEITHKTAL